MNAGSKSSYCNHQKQLTNCSLQSGTTTVDLISILSHLLLLEGYNGDPGISTESAMDYVEKRVAQEAAKTATAAESTLFTPLNIILVSVLLYTAYAILRPSPPPKLPKEEPAIVFKTYTPRTLLPFNGENDSPVYLAVRGRVFDVSRGRNFYGPGGPYENFAGRDASRGLAKGSFDEDMLTEDLDGPLDTLADLNADELEALQGWEERFLEKYMVVGKLVAAGEETKA